VSDIDHKAAQDRDGEFIGTKTFDGGFVIYRKAARAYRKNVGGQRMPRFRHKTFKSAEADANRLLGDFPESTFVILQELATVKVRSAPQEIES
jgi:hypothetical protein